MHVSVAPYYSNSDPRHNSNNLRYGIGSDPHLIDSIKHALAFKSNINSDMYLEFVLIYLF